MKCMDNQGSIIGKKKKFHERLVLLSWSNTRSQSFKTNVKGMARYLWMECGMLHLYYQIEQAL